MTIIRSSSLIIMDTHRFVFSPIPDLEKKMGKDTSDLKKEVENLGKKLQYLETTHKNSTEHINQIFQSGGGRA